MSRARRGGIGASIALVIAAATTSMTAAATARYHVLGAGEGSKLWVTDLRITVIGAVRDEATGRDCVDWQTDVTLADGQQLAVRALSTHAPMTSPNGCGEFLRYRLRLPDGQVFDYRHERTGRAVLPPVAFRELFLPVPEDEPVFVDGFACAGRYLAHVVVLDRVTTDSSIVPIKKAAVLDLRPDLLVGTSRNVKDDGKGRPTPTANYNFIPLDGRDYDELIAAGTNYFGVAASQLQWVQRRPVFYRGPGVFPQDWYRSNYMPIPMFSDEPMVRLGWEGAAPARLDHPQQIASYLKSRVQHIYCRKSGLEQIYRVFDTPLELSPWDHQLVPTWETEYQAAFYELAGGAPGIVHEGRYVKEGYGWHPSALFGPGLEVTTREMLQCFYAFLRGAARAFDGDWGTSIYGQSDPAMRLEALTLAYDMGAKYLWFWTSDHDHHMVFPDQVTLARQLMQHAAAHPRGEFDALREGVKVGIAFPAGYTLSWEYMWGQPALSFEVVNRTGTTYREVVAAAMWEGVLCAKRGIPFDFTVEHAGLADLGYEQLLIVGEDASVTPVPNRVTASVVRPAVELELSGPTACPVPAPPPDAVLAIPVHDRDMIIDGKLDDWAGAAFVEHCGQPSGESTWDGPADFATAVAFAYDGSFLYVAAVVDDDRQEQPYYGWELWKGDSVQVAFDPLNEDVEPGYTSNQHEIGFAQLADGRPVAWRWSGRRGQATHEMPDLDVAIREAQVSDGPEDRPGRGAIRDRIRDRREQRRGRDERRGPTRRQLVYEAAIPLSELGPLSPATTPTVGVAATFNDGEDGCRQAYHETSPGTMTEGKHPTRFRKLHFVEPQEQQRRSEGGPRSWASIVWGSTVAPVDGALTAECRTASWGNARLRLTATLEPLQPLSGLPGRRSISFDVGAESQSRRLRVMPVTEPGRYRMTLTVADETLATLADESMIVFVHP